MKLVNLLPKPRQQELRFEIIFHGLLVVFILSVVSFALVFLAQFGAKLYLAARSQALNAEIVQLTGQVNKAENANIKKQIQGINDTISDFNNLAAASPKWSNLLKAFAPLTPQGAQITSLSVDTTKKSITVNGFSPTRALVIQFYNNVLADTDNFSNIDYPLENIVSATDVNFHFTFNFQAKLLQ